MNIIPLRTFFAETFAYIASLQRAISLNIEYPTFRLNLILKWIELIGFLFSSLLISKSFHYIEVLKSNVAQLFTKFYGKFILFTLLLLLLNFIAPILHNYVF